jgi:integrase
VSGRAAAGESTIYQDPAGRWHGNVSMGLKAGGKRDRRHVSGLRRAVVVTKIRELERRRDTGTARTTGQSMTVGVWLDHWLDTIAVRRVRPSTLHRYRQLVTHQLRPQLGHYRLDKLQPEHLEALYKQLLNGGLAPATVLQAHRVLSRATKVALQRGRVARNVATLVDAPSVEHTEVDPLTAEEARKVLATAADIRNGARWSVALALGLRQGEALGLTWPALDLDAGTLSVRQALQRQPWTHGCAETDQCGPARKCPERRGGGLILVPPKSRAGRRTIALPKPLIELLKTHRSQQHRERLAAGPIWEDHELVFCQLNGRPLDPRADHRAWRNLLRQAGVRQARLHDARHTAATLLLQQGVPARVAMQILGHSQVTLTLGTYSHVVPEIAHDAAQRIGAALWA